MATVSVIVPNYNHARFLPKRIESILAQTYQDFELILLDDCSTDESREILARYAGDARVRIGFNEANSGSTFKQWNKGVGMARGKYVWIGESDDYADERLLERLVGLLEKDERVVYAYCRSWTVSEEGQVAGFADSYLDGRGRWESDFCVDGHEECRRFFCVSNVVPNASGVVFRRAAYEQAGGADESFRMCGDWKIWAAMALCGKVAYVSEPLNYYRFHGASVRQRMGTTDNVTEALRVVHWVLDQVTPDDATLRELRSRYATLWVPLVVSARVPREKKRAIMREVGAIDPHPYWRAVGPSLTALRMTLRRRWRDLTAWRAPALGERG